MIAVLQEGNVDKHLIINIHNSRDTTDLYEKVQQLLEDQNDFDQKRQTLKLMHKN